MFVYSWSFKSVWYWAFQEKCHIIATFFNECIYNSDTPLNSEDISIILFKDSLPIPINSSTSFSVLCFSYHKSLLLLSDSHLLSHCAVCFHQNNLFGSSPSSIKKYFNSSWISFINYQISLRPNSLYLWTRYDFHSATLIAL